VDSTVRTLARLRSFARAVSDETKEVDVALPAVRALLTDAGVPFRFAGGVAVVHHGYLRTTEDIDVLVEGSCLARLTDEVLAAHGFARTSRTRLRHGTTGVRVDLLVSNEEQPRRPGVIYPAPSSVAASARDPDFVALAPLLELKLEAARHRDISDVMELLKRVSDQRYLELEAAMPAALRPELARLRRDALEELAFEE
jgi:hypothetical protein